MKNQNFAPKKFNLVLTEAASEITTPGQPSERSFSLNGLQRSTQNLWRYTLVALGGVSSMVAICLGLGTSDAQRLDSNLLRQVKPNASLIIGKVTPFSQRPGNPRLKPVLIENETWLSVPVTIQLNPFPDGSKSGPINVFVCATDQQGNCLQDVFGPESRSFSNVTSDAPVSATLRIKAPTAGARSKLRLNLCQEAAPGDTSHCDQLLTTAESEEMPVAARYQVALRDINTLDIASPHSDTLYVALQANLKGSPADCTPENCKQAPPDPTHYPNEAYSPSDQTSGSHYPVLGMVIGPFTLVPDSDPDIVVSFAVFNFGAGYDNASAASLRTRINNTLAGARALGPDDKTFDTMKQLKASEFPWHGCDGPLAADWVELPNHGPGDTIATTTNGGQAWQPPKTQVKPYEGPPRSGGCRDSKYRIALTVERISKP
jgi:hypothetical protein